MTKIQQTKRIVLVFICACYIIFSSVSCSKKPTVPAPLPDISDTLEGVSKEIKVNVYIDATISMTGFVVPSSATNYIQTLQANESAISTGWGKTKIDFFQFGEKIISLGPRGHIKAVKKDFYENPEVMLTTHIEKVINKPDTCSNNSLTIIVTDLFQTDADVSLLTNVLSDKCLKNKFAVGVLGLKSQYNGDVHDVGIQSAHFQYKNNDKDIKTFRPFYLLVLGKHADVANYFEQLKSMLPFITDTFTIFSPYIVNPLASFEGASMDEIHGLAEVSNIMSFTSPGSIVKQFNIRNDANAWFMTTLKHNQLPYTMPFDIGKLTTEVIAKQFNSNNEFKENSVVNKSFNIEWVDGLKFKATITPTTLPGDGIYSYEIIIRPSKNAYNESYWWNDWNMDLNKIDKWILNPNTFDGSKTLNLNLFMNSLFQANLQTHQPKIARIYCYYKK